MSINRNLSRKWGEVWAFVLLVCAAHSNAGSALQKCGLGGSFETGTLEARMADCLKSNGQDAVTEKGNLVMVDAQGKSWWKVGKLVWGPEIEKDGKTEFTSDEASEICRSPFHIPFKQNFPAGGGFFDKDDFIREAQSAPLHFRGNYWAHPTALLTSTPYTYFNAEVAAIRDARVLIGTSLEKAKVRCVADLKNWILVNQPSTGMSGL